MEYTFHKLVRFARVRSHVTDLNARNKSLTANFPSKAIGIINFEILVLFSKFYRRQYELVSKFNVELKTLLH